MRAASAGAPSPAALTKAPAVSAKPSLFSSSVRTSTPFCPASTELTLVRKANMAPAASASPRSDNISAWLSTMPVDGDSRAPAQRSAGSRCSASARLSS